MKYRITHTTKYAYSEPASVCQNKVHLAPRVLENQKVSNFQLLISPEPAAQSTQRDYFGNRVEYFSIPHPHRGLSVTATSLIRKTPSKSNADQTKSPAWDRVIEEVNSLADDDSSDALQFAFASPMIRKREDFAALARDGFSPGSPIVEGCLAITEKIFTQFQYDPRATTVSTPVEQVLEKRAGVCQDFAHLQIACLRSLGIPARYVSGYLRTIPPEGKPRLVGADASHAWVSVYCGRELGWIDFDPTNNVIPATDHITIGWGRDYGDLCPIQGVFIGGGDNRMEVSVDVATIS